MSPQIEQARTRTPAGDGPSNARIVRLLLLAAVGYLIWRVVQPLWHPIAWAMLLGILLAPFNRRLGTKLGGRPVLASSITLILAVVFFVVPLGLIASELASQAAHLQSQLDAPLATGSSGPANEPAQLRSLERWVEQAAVRANVSADKVRSWLSVGGHQLLDKLAASSGPFVKGVFGAAVNFTLMLFVLFFALRDGPSVSQRILNLLPVESERRTLFWQHLIGVTRGVFLGVGAAAVVHGSLIGLGWWIAGLPSPLVLGLIAAVLALIPVVGSALVWVPGVLFLFFTGNAGPALFLAIWSVVLVSGVDHVLRPLLISGQASVPALPVFLGVIGGLHAFGFIGLFIGPIVLGMMVALFRYQEALQLAEQRSDTGQGIAP
jgi:predicted PurR-regulated permease PerM